MNALDLTQAVFIQNQQIKTDCLKVAQAFGKRHTNILRAIENLDCAKSFTQLNFELSDYIDSTGRVLPKYEMTQDLPEPKLLQQELSQSTQPYPHYLKCSHAVRSILDNKTHRYLLFKPSQALLGGAA